MRPRKPPLWLPIFFMIFRTVIWILPCVVCRLFCLPFLIATILNMGHYQQLFYVIFSLLNYYIDVEVRTPRGRVDVVLRTKTTLYVMELKLDKTAGEAMEQINLKNYPERFALCGLPVVKVAINFDSERCTIGDWMIEK